MIQRHTALLRHDSVAKGSKTVNPRGRPISASTNVGANRRPVFPRDMVPTFLGAWRPSKPLVGALLLGSVPSFQSLAVGVAQLRARSVSVMPECRPLAVEYPAAPQLFESPATGVGQHKDALAPVRSPTGFVRSVYSPRDSVPQFSIEILEDVLESSLDDSGDIFQSNNCWPNLGDDSSGCGPESSRVFFRFAFAGNAVGLTRNSGSDERNSPTPRLAVEGEQIRPNRTRVQPPFLHARRQDGTGKSFPFDHTDCASAWKRQSDSEVESSHSGTEREYLGTKSHISHRRSRGTHHRHGRRPRTETTRTG